MATVSVRSSDGQLWVMAFTRETYQKAILTAVKWARAPGLSFCWRDMEILAARVFSAVDDASW